MYCAIPQKCHNIRFSLFASLYHLQVSCQIGYNLLTYLSKTTLFVDPLTLSHVAILAPSDAQNLNEKMSQDW